MERLSALIDYLEHLGCLKILQKSAGTRIKEAVLKISIIETKIVDRDI